MSPVQAKQRRDAAGTSEQILDAAEDLFAEHGFAHVSIRQIAEKAGVTKSLIHHHFGSKEELWDLVKERAFSGYVNSQTQALLGSKLSEELLSDGIRAYFEYLDNNPNFVRLTSWAQVQGDTKIVGSELIGLSAMRVKEAQDAGLIRADLNPAMLVAHFISTTTYWFQAKCLFHPVMEEACRCDPLDEKQVNELFIDNMVKVFMRGVMADDQK